MYGKSQRNEHEPEFLSVALLHIEILRARKRLADNRPIAAVPRCVVTFLLSLVNVAADQGVALTQKF